MSMNQTLSALVASMPIPTVPQSSSTIHQQSMQTEEKVYKKEKQILIEFDLKTKGYYHELLWVFQNSVLTMLRPSFYRSSLNTNFSGPIIPSRIVDHGFHWQLTLSGISRLEKSAEWRRQMSGTAFGNPTLVLVRAARFFQEACRSRTTILEGSRQTGQTNSGQAQIGKIKVWMTKIYLMWMATN